MRPINVLCAFAMLAGTLAINAQTFTATVAGSVIDASGAAIPNATVTATNVATNVHTETRSDGTGRYLLPQLQPGAYRLESAAAGFKKYVHRGIELNVGQQAQVDISMTVGEVTENVTVEGTVSAIETTSSTIGKVVSNRAILDLPLNSRNIYSLIYLTPGVAGSIGNNYNSMSYSVNGARASMMDTLIDGATASHPTVQGYSGISAFPSVDAIGEFKVLGANFPAEYGRTAGSVLNVVYKSGTNQFHGTAYEFLRNSALDANTFYNNLRGDPARQLQAEPVRRHTSAGRSSRTDLLHELRTRACGSGVSARGPPRCRRHCSGQGTSPKRLPEQTIRC